MFPLRDNIPAKYFPLVNVSLILVNIGCFIYEISLGPGMDRFVLDYGFVPARYTWEQSANFLDLSRFVAPLTSMFLHGGWLHVISNMWMLWIFGDNVEDRMGHQRYLGFYLACGLVAVGAQYFSNPQAQMPMVGASGAISGVLGAYFFLYPRARILTLIPIFIFFYTMEIPAYFFLGFWFFMQFIQGTAQFSAHPLNDGGVAWWAHIGGFGAGTALVWFFRRR